MTREELIKELDGIVPKNPKSDWSIYQRKIVDEAIKTLEQESSFQKKAEIVISQLRADRDRLQDAFDKVRAEIETKYGQCDICEYFEDYDYEENDISEYRPIGDIADILQIIDKYKAESEG